MCFRYGKETKSTSGLKKHLNAYTKKVPQITHLQIYHKLHNDKLDISDKELEDGSQLLGKNNCTVRDTTDSPTKIIPWNELLASDSLSSLRKEWFIRSKFSASIAISNIKYNYPRIKHQNSFYPFNDQLDYALAHYFAESETRKGNINKFSSDPLMTPLTEKLFYKNADK